MTDKSKELKKIEANLKKSESRVKELLERNSEKGKKISELENANTRLKVMKVHALEIEEKIKHQRRIHDEESTKKRDTKIAGRRMRRKNANLKILEPAEEKIAAEITTQRQLASPTASLVPVLLSHDANNAILMESAMNGSSMGLAAMEMAADTGTLLALSC